MKVRVETPSIVTYPCDLIAVNLFEGVKAPSGATKAVDKALGGYIAKLIKNGEITGKKEEATLIALNLGLQIKKVWRGILNDRIRPTHLAANGQTVPLNQNFIVGGYLAQTPRDSRLPASESSRCRCYVEYSRV